MPRLHRTLALVIAAVAAFAAPGAAAPTVANFAATVPAGLPRNVAAGPDGTTMWFTYSANAGGIGKVTSAGAASRYSLLPADANPWDIVTGPDNGLWVTGHDRSEIYRFSALGGLPSTYTLPGPAANPTGITSGPDGALWFTHTGGGGGIGRITTTGTFTMYSAGLTPNGAPQDIAAGPDGNLWFTITDLPGIGRIDTAGNITEYGAGLLAGDAPQQITSGPDGNLWVTLAGGTGAIARVVPGTGAITRYAAGLPAGGNPAGIATAGGRVWFSLRTADRVGSIGTDGAIEMIPSLGTGIGPEGMAPDTLGKVWFAGRNAPARVSRIDPSGTPGPDAPAVAAGTASPGVSDATITAAVTPNGLETEWRLEFGRTPALGSYGDAGTVAAGAAPGAPVTARVAGLVPDTAYWYRLVVQNASGTASTDPAPFTTEPAPPNTPPPATEQPVMGRSVIATPLTGTVTVRLPGSRTELPLAAVGGQIPMGSRVDTRRGRVRIRTALRAGTQSAEFWGGRFTIRQAARREMLTLVTERTPFAGCGRRGARPAARLASAGTAARRRRVLWGKDHGGKFRTHGYDSVAVTRGTVWGTIETCAGTTTRVLAGSVSVRDLRARRTVLVRARGRYLARRAATPS